MQIYIIPFAAKESGDSFSVSLAARLWERVDECRNISKQRREREKEEPEDSSAESEGHRAKAERGVRGPNIRVPKAPCAECIQAWYSA